MLGPIAHTLALLFPWSALEGVVKTKPTSQLHYGLCRWRQGNAGYFYVSPWWSWHRLDLEPLDLRYWGHGFRFPKIKIIFPDLPTSFYGLSFSSRGSWQMCLNIQRISWNLVRKILFHKSPTIRGPSGTRSRLLHCSLKRNKLIVRACGHLSFNVKGEKTFLIQDKTNRKSLSISPEKSQD